MPQQLGATGLQVYTAAPAVGIEGATYFNSTTDTIYVSSGTAWVAVGAAAPTTAVPASAAFSASYPIGVSVYNISAAESTADGGWPVVGAAGQVLTIRNAAAAGTLANQLWMRSNTTTPQMYHRVVAAAANSAWTEVNLNQSQPWLPYMSLNNAALTPSVPNNAWTLIPLATAEGSRGTTLTAMGSGNGVTIGKAGRYRISGGGEFTASAAANSRRGAGYTIVSPTATAQTRRLMVSWALNSTVPVFFSIEANLALNATIGLIMFQDSGGAVTASGCYLSVDEV